MVEDTPGEVQTVEFRESSARLAAVCPTECLGERLSGVYVLFVAKYESEGSFGPG